MRVSYDLAIASTGIAMVCGYLASVVVLFGEWFYWSVLITAAVVLMTWPVVYEHKWGLDL